MTAEDRKLTALTKQLREQARRESELDKQRPLLEEVDMLDLEDTIRVLKVNVPALVLIDAETATVKVPAFQFLNEDGQVKRDEVTDTPVINSGVLAVFQQQSPGFDRPSKLNAASAWHAMYWWVTEMRLDVSDPESRPFRPIDVVCDPQMLADLVDWLKDWRDESYG